MAEIEVGKIVIGAPKFIEPHEVRPDREIKVRRISREVRASFRFYGEGAEGTANFGLLMEYHPELEAHCDAIRLYMKQQARRLLEE